MPTYWKIKCRSHSNFYKVVIRKSKITAVDIYDVAPDPIPGTPGCMTAEERRAYDGYFTSYENASVIAMIASDKLNIVDVEIEKW